MKYVYNAERDRLKSAVWNPYFFIATYEDRDTKEQRAMYLYTSSGLERHIKTIAEKFMNEEETLSDIQRVSQKQYEQWLCGGDYVEINGQEIPSEHITMFLIAKDRPSGTKEKETGDPKIGNLEQMRNRLRTRDDNLCQEILESFNLAKEENDIVREVDDVKSDPLYDNFNKNYLEK